MARQRTRWLKRLAAARLVAARLAAVLLAAIAALALLAACAAGLSQLIYGRSLQASVYERMLLKRFATDVTAEAEIARLEARRAEAEPSAAVPDYLDSDIAVERGERNGMAYFTLSANAEPDTAIFYLHGGAFINGFNYYHWSLMSELVKRTGARVIAPDYHLAPFADYRRAYEDVPGLYREYAAAHPGQRLLLMGDSAGGGLALGVAEYLVQNGDPLPERLILFSPWVDLSMDNPDIEDYLPVEPILHLELVKVHRQFWAGDSDIHDWMVSPLYGELAGLPPVVLYAGTRELLYPDLTLLYGKLTAAGVEAELRVGRGLNHEYPLMPIPEGRAAVREAVGIINGGR